MSKLFDPITTYLNKSAWLLWAVLWMSLAAGIGQEDFNISNTEVDYDTTLSSTIACILLWGAMLLQIVRQLFYGNLGPNLVRLGRWIILGATTIFCFRMTFMLVMYGGAPSSQATLVGVSLLAIGLSLNSIGMMQEIYFQEKKDTKIKWNNSWRLS